jgi:hypothetical protein
MPHQETPTFYGINPVKDRMDAVLPPQFERTGILLDAGEQARLARAHVLVAGLGGVGSYCAEALARAGVGRLTIIDSRADGGAHPRHQPGVRTQRDP